MTATCAGERIYFDGDSAKFLCLVAMGKVKLLRNAILGREVLLDILRSGEYFGALTALCGQERFSVHLCPKALKAFCASD